MTFIYNTEKNRTVNTIICIETNFINIVFIVYTNSGRENYRKNHFPLVYSFFFAINTEY